MVYLYVYGIDFKRLSSYFNKMADDAEEQEELRLILPEEEEPDAILEEEEEEVLQIYDFEGTGEQLRRLRAYNPILADETDDAYANRIWSIAYKEDEEEEKRKEKEKKDTTVWYTIEDKKGRYKGEWMNGIPNGKGIKHIYEGDYYIEGNFVDGFAEGHCKQTFEQTWEMMQPYYEGEFKRNEYNGEGEYHYGDGYYYKGQWKDSKYHGQGAEYSKRRNKTWVGYFENDEKVNGHWVRGEI